MHKKTVSNLMAPPLLGSDSLRRSVSYPHTPTSSFAATPADDHTPLIPSSKPGRAPLLPSAAASSQPPKSLEEAAQAVRERLPGRSKKAKDQFRRQQRVEKGDEWRGRLSGYCPSDSLDCAKLTQHLKQATTTTNNSSSSTASSLLYTRKWRVKAYFDVLHLHSSAPSAAAPSTTASPVPTATALSFAPSAASATPTPFPDNMFRHQDSENEYDDVGGSHTLRRLDSLRSANESCYDTEEEASVSLASPPPTNAPLQPFASTSPPPRIIETGPAARPLDDASPELDVFLFGFGPVVFWGFANEQAERDVLKDLVPFVEGEWHDPVAAESAKEEMEFVQYNWSGGTGGGVLGNRYGSSTNLDEARSTPFGLGVVNDLIELTALPNNNTISSRRNKPAAEKLAISSALAQSCHLSIYESRLSDTISRYSHIPKKLAEEGKIDMTGDEISREIGRLFVERNLINLEPELLDTPEFLWNDSEFEPLYKNVYRYLEVEPRIEVLNKRLSIVGELLEVLKSQQEHQHASHLEFIVVVLVGMEVLIQLVWNILLKDMLGWVGGQRRD